MIGHGLREKFPQIQFIVATHSPFIAQVADDNASDLAARDPDTSNLGGNIKLEQTVDGVKALSDVEPAQDLRVDQILQGPLFDLDSLYSPKIEEKLKLHSELHRKKQSGQLSPSERQDLEQLEFWRESLPMLTDPKERQLEQTLQKAVERYSDQLQKIS
jgi:hypothetical protein